MKGSHCPSACPKMRNVSSAVWHGRLPTNISSPAMIFLLTIGFGAARSGACFASAIRSGARNPSGRPKNGRDLCRCHPSRIWAPVESGLLYPLDRQTPHPGAPDSKHGDILLSNCRRIAIPCVSRPRSCPRCGVCEGRLSGSPWHKHPGPVPLTCLKDLADQAAHIATDRWAAGPTASQRSSQ